MPSSRADDSSATATLPQQLHDALKQANPDYQQDGRLTTEDGRLVAINLMRCNGVSDLSPLKKFDPSTLKSVNLYKATAIFDLSPLTGCRFTQLNLERCDRISDLTPLKGMPLKFLSLFGCPNIKDYSVLGTLTIETLYFDPPLLSESEITRVRGMATLLK